MKEIKNKDKKILENKINILNDVDLNEESLTRIREGLRLVLSEGTGKFYVPQGLDFAGKTGTSESFLDTNNDGKVDTATISSSFAGFYPSEDPKFSIVVITPNVSHKNGKTDAFYFGASKITKDIVNYLNEKY
jgi:cell division protein FtsI/penicillin-binding protein 2